LCILDRKQTQIKTQTSRFTWFPKTGYVHRGSRLYIIGGMIQIFISTQYNPTKSSVSLLHSVFLLNLHLHSLSQLHCLPLSAHTCTVSALHDALSRLCLHLYKKEEPWQQPMCRLINANQLLVMCYTVDCTVLHCGCIVSTFTVDCTVWRGCYWAGGQGCQPGGKLPSARSARPWALAQTKSTRGALAATPTGRSPKCRVALDFLSLGCRPSAK
jgi:hypothetical protein